MLKIIPLILVICYRCSAYNIYAQNIYNYNEIYTFDGIGDCVSVSSSYVTICDITAGSVYYNQYSTLTECVAKGCDITSDVNAVSVGVNVTFAGLNEYIVYYQAECMPTYSEWTDWVSLPVYNVRSTTNRCVIRNTNYTCNVGSCENGITVYERFAVIPTSRNTLITDVCNYDSSECFVSPASTYPYNYPPFFFGSSSPVTDGWTVYFQGYNTSQSVIYTTYTINITQSNINILSANPYAYASLKAAQGTTFNGSATCAIFYITGSNISISGFNISNIICNQQVNYPRSKYPLIVINGDNVNMSLVHGFTNGVLAYIHDSNDVSLVGCTEYVSGSLSVIYNGNSVVISMVYPIQYVYVIGTNNGCGTGNIIDVVFGTILCNIYDSTLSACNCDALSVYVNRIVPTDINVTLIGIIGAAIFVSFVVVIIAVYVHKMKRKKD